MKLTFVLNIQQYSLCLPEPNNIASKKFTH